VDAYLVSLTIFCLIYLLLGLGLNLQYGFTGLMNFGVVGFYALGAYTSALLTVHGYSIVIGLVAAIIGSAIAAIPLGILSLRLRDDYLAVLTLAFAEVVRLVLSNEAWLTKGTQGIANIPQPFQQLPYWSQQWAFLGVLLVLNAVAAWALVRIVKSPFGRTITAIRDDEIAVKSLAKDPTVYKIQVFMIGSGLFGLAGALQAHYLTYISPEQFLPIITFYVWMAILMGGVGNLGGSLLGTAFLVLLLEGSRFARDAFPMVSEIHLASLRLIAIGTAIIVFTIYRPQGILGKAR
jgi:branched-chain amino acid transport system permease protein